MEEFEEKEVEELVKRFKNMVNSGVSTFFEDDEMELIIDHFMQNFDFANATKAIDYAISLFPTDSFFRILRVKKLIMELQIDEAEEELNKIETMFPPSTDLYIEKVMLSRITGSDAHAMDLLSKAYALDPNDPDVHFLMAYEYLKRNNISKGIEHAIIAMEEDEGFDENLFTFSYLFDDNKQYEAAIQFFTALSDRFPLNKGTWFGLGLAYSWVENHERAIDAYQYALAIDDSISTAYFNIANSFFDMGKPEQALENYQKAVELDEEDYTAINGIADCYAVQENYPEALKYYHKALLVAPNYVNSILGIISILKETNRMDEAKLFIEKAFKLSPQSFDLLFAVLEYYEPEEREETMLDLFNITLGHVENKADFYKYFTMFCCANEKYDLGIEILKEHLDDENITYTAPYYLAALCFLSGDSAQGSEYLKNALLINYKGYEDFLALDPLLETYDEILTLIQMYRSDI